jgi:hypothetical protein
MKRGVTNFFKYARARHRITLDRAAGKPRLWTKDPILQQYRFTNVFRELDKTTVWFRKHVREPMRSSPDVLLATVVFRLLNRIEVGEAIFCQSNMLNMGMKTAETGFDAFLRTGDVLFLKRAILAYVGPTGPYVTGAYIISSPAGYKKLDGVLEVINRFYKQTREWPIVAESFDANIGYEDAAQLMRVNPREDYTTLEACWTWLKQFDYFGPFHAYEIVTDLRHTVLLDHATDINTWANPGPGAKRGANRVHGRDKMFNVPRDQLIDEIRALLVHSRDAMLWPQGGKVTKQLAQNALHWPKWEMRDVEHTLCEFDKYERVRLGEGRPRGVYK